MFFRILGSFQHRFRLEKGPGLPGVSFFRKLVENENLELTTSTTRKSVVCWCGFALVYVVFGSVWVRFGYPQCAVASNLNRKGESNHNSDGRIEI